MRKLLSANFSRLRRDKVFWICLAAVLILSVVLTLSTCREASSGLYDYDYFLDDAYFNLAPLIGLFIAIFTSLFMGTEYSDGTVRNKIIVGHTRLGIYLANFAVCFSAGLAFTATWLIGGLIGIPFLGTWQLGAQGLAQYVLIAIFLAVAWTGIMVLISTVSTNKALTAVGTILIFFVLIIAATAIYNRLEEPETISGMMMTVDGTIQMSDPEPNPLYISGAARTVWEWILNIIPTGQGILMANHEIAHPIIELVGSALITISTTLLGIFAFRRKNLK